MTYAECVELLRWAMPRLGLRWDGFRNLRRQVCRRVVARAKDLGLDAAAYRARLEADADELARFDALCFITISRFYRDAATFDALRTMMREFAGELRVWSAGCASGEEPYTVAMLATSIGRRAEILATDRDDAVLARAAIGRYGSSSLSELPAELRAIGFDGDAVRPPIRAQVRFERADVRTFDPGAPLHVVLCRNVVFTYFDEATQLAFADRVARMLVKGGLLVVGKGESVPSPAFTPTDAPLIWRATPEMRASAR
jgi:chemotaxis protein methyltransferase CheR